MKHQTKTLKFRSGKDSNKMILRKLLRNFLVSSTIETTDKRGRAIKKYMDILVTKAKEKNEANKNFILSYLPYQDLVGRLFDSVGPAMKDVHGGYIRLVRLSHRDSDSARMVRVEWAHPLVVDAEVVEKKVAKPKKEKVISEEATA